uniref:Cytochrome c oxidase assembly protein subunit 15 n=1 Tax=Kwoniella pini CBS 10737 TaxID=1296096 RepID=A0A1B9HTK3_9TREE|nr:cytochrome c oxidase assembly protein subunit 15 [Kwoniella pini CBS 10737]OCF46590.1 cytochrome c oxidase assembly protein subunit 15 [Kwoniella pini CBS 10737]
MASAGLSRGLWNSIRSQVSPIASRSSTPTIASTSTLRAFSSTSIKSLRSATIRPQPFNLPYFTPSSKSTFFFPSHTFTFPRTLTTTPAIPEIPRSLPYWLYGCSALVFGIIVIGGVTRLTESGLSIVEWKPFKGIIPPITAEEWEAEWEKYRISPEGIMMNSKMDMHEFKKIFYMEWGHRIAGRALGLLFIIPAAYYTIRYKLPKPIPIKLALIGLGIGFQGFLGWWMVKSGLEQEIIDNNSVPRVSQYRLATHLSAAFLLYLGMLSTAIGIQRDMKLLKNPNILSQLTLPSVKRLRGMVHGAGMMVFLTAVTGAFVAGLDAGLVYNEWPTMGDGFIPPSNELMDEHYTRGGTKSIWRNITENPVTAQFDHRMLAYTTFSLVVSLPFIARKVPFATSRRLAGLTAAAAITQVTLGITTLLYLVPVPLAAMHQAGSVVLLTCIMALGGSLRKPSRMLRHLRR